MRHPGPLHPIVLLLSLAAFLTLAPGSSRSGDLSAAQNSTGSECNSVEECFRVASAEPPASMPSAERLSYRLDRLRTFREAYAGSIWAERAGLLTGLLIAEDHPAESLQFLRAARRDLPILEDYIRLWMGDSILRLGEPARAAFLFDSIPSAIPDTLLGTQAAFRGGEAQYQADQCGRAIGLLSQAVEKEPENVDAATALLHLADCQIRQDQTEAGIETLEALWVAYPQTSEAEEAKGRLDEGVGGVAWQPTREDHYKRAMVYRALSLHKEAIPELEEFLAEAPKDPLRERAQLDLGTSLVRLKRYTQARKVFEEVAAGTSKEAAKATYWLARVYLRQGDGEALLKLPRSFARLPISGPQQSAILYFTGIWLEDEGRVDEAIVKYRKAARIRRHSQWGRDAQWRIAWIQYRAGQYPDSVRTLQKLAGSRQDEPVAPQALYWTARARDRQEDPKAMQTYQHLCQTYPLTYYCQ
ncbi:MAG: tetratricopeptide repeat protein, partial [Nitrospiraceae bacterium]